MPFPSISRVIAGRRRRRSLALAVRLFECGSESEMARAILTLGAASLFERYLEGAMNLAEPPPARSAERSAEPAETEAGRRIVPFARATAPAEGT